MSVSVCVCVDPFLFPLHYTVSCLENSKPEVASSLCATAQYLDMAGTKRDIKLAASAAAARPR